MKKLSSILSTNKKGAASLYIVIFTTILFGVITLSFIRVILSESRQSSNDDLSQSAYDAALAGVEDAKIAVNQYYKCLSSNDSSCAQYRGKPLFGGNCSDNYLQKYLGREDSSNDSEVKVQESSSNNSDQAYTCVLISDEVSDYRATLTSDTRTKVVPIGVRRGSDGNYTNNNLQQVKTIEFSWYSDLNGTKLSHLDHNGKFADKQNATVPPTVSLTLIRAKGNINLKDLNTDNNGDNYSTMVLLPSESGAENTTNNITNSQIVAAGNVDAENSPFQISCQSGGDFACKVELTSLSFDAEDSAFLVVALPYGDEYTDFKIVLKDSNGSEIAFKGVQVSVDSTGRTNQLIRRVETRLDPADLFFPYPQYELDLDGSPDDDALRKRFWITNNCWTERGGCNNNGQL